MKICLVAEGCYPYVVGGVSGWIHSMIKSFPKVEFVVLAIISNRSQSGKFVYELPENVSAVYEAYLDDYDWGHKPKHGKRTGLDTKEYRALRSIIMNEEVDWDTIFDMFQKGDFSIDDLLMGADFLNIVKECYNLRYPHIVFSDFLWTMRSIYLPLFLILKTELPKADIYHCVATGYAGVLGSMASHFYRSGLLVSEHGIYTREREEELLKAEWVAGIYKNIWIDQFKKMSRLAYERADVVTSLYSHARELQIGLGCPEGKIRVTPNGIDVDRMADLPGKKEEDKGYINIGAVLRVTPIKDVKTMIRAFAFAKEENDSLKLWIMGPCDEDEEYAGECFELVEALQVKDVVFTGRIDVREYLGRMDYTILTSISEGQPLTILESYAAHKPVIATDVGNCRELIYGEGDGCGTAGILTHIMNIAELSSAMLELARSGQLRAAMGECGYQRVMKGYRIQQMKQSYEDIYEQIGWVYGKLWPAETYHMGEVRVERKYEERPLAAAFGYGAGALDGYDIEVEFGPGTGSGYDIDFDIDAEGNVTAVSTKGDYADVSRVEGRDSDIGSKNDEKKSKGSISSAYGMNNIAAMGRVVGMEHSAGNVEHTKSTVEGRLPDVPDDGGIESTVIMRESRKENAEDNTIVAQDDSAETVVNADTADKFADISDGSGNGVVIDYENLISRHVGKNGRTNVSPLTNTNGANGLAGTVTNAGTIAASRNSSTGAAAVSTGAGSDGSALNNVINNAINTALNNAIQDAVNHAVNKAVNNVDSALNVMINNAVNNALNNAISNVVNQAVNHALNNAVNHALNNALNSALESNTGNMTADTIGLDDGSMSGYAKGQ